MVYYIVRVNHDNRDTFAHEELASAIEMAQADPGDSLDYTTIEASDPSLARLSATRKDLKWTSTAIRPL
jgi:hypothetical protein